MHPASPCRFPQAPQPTPGSCRKWGTIICALGTTGLSRTLKESQEQVKTSSFGSICPAKWPGDDDSYLLPLLIQALARCRETHWIQPQLHQITSLASSRGKCLGKSRAGLHQKHPYCSAICDSDHSKCLTQRLSLCKLRVFNLNYLKGCLSVFGIVVLWVRLKEGSPTCWSWAKATFFVCVRWRWPQRKLVLHIHIILGANDKTVAMVLARDDIIQVTDKASNTYLYPAGNL